MHTPRHSTARFLGVALFVLVAVACNANASTPAITVTTIEYATNYDDAKWFSIPMVDARTNQSFTLDDFKGKVVLVETMAVWCPNCRIQQDQVKKLHNLLGNPPDLVSVSLDVDLHEDQAILARHVAEGGFDWRFAVAPLAVDHALGNLYNAEYLNPPLTPMLLIDRQGKVIGLPYGYKSAEALKPTVELYLSK